LKEAELLREAWAKSGMENAVSQVPERMARDLVLVGTPEDCLKRAEEYRRAGVKLTVIQPAYSLGDLDSNVRPCIDTFGR
jgi:alkanesulfonate monooxygenase SsuD/methylene tetrahydromethanopterin reductase-like flavin-dependent oxidoreductase (luciferase family)